MARYINEKTFRRIDAAFAALCFSAPIRDSGETGAYDSNIVEQYKADMTAREVQSVIDYAFDTSLDSIKNSPLTLQEIVNEFC